MGDDGIILDVYSFLWSMNGVLLDDIEVRFEFL